MILSHRHLCHPNRKLVLNNKDYDQYDNKGEGEQGCKHFGVEISLDYRPINQFVKRQFPCNPALRWASLPDNLVLTRWDAGDITAANMNPGRFGMTMSTTTSRNDREVFVVGQK